MDTEEMELEEMQLEEMELEEMELEERKLEERDFDGGVRAALGRAGEEAALQVYLRNGFRLIARNWRCGVGELDLVVRRGRLLVFCEVKTRSTIAMGGGYEAVTWSKRRRLRRLAEAFLSQTPVRPAATRFDVASVHVSRGSPPDVEVYQDAF
jgi:putative endonuclease